MTGAFTEKDPQRCAHYAQFMQHLGVGEANAIFFTFFVTVLVLLYVASRQHNKSAALKDDELVTSRTTTQYHYTRSLHRQKRKTYLVIAFMSFIVSIVCVILEAFAILNIEYCDGEDLINLYWSFWSILQVGSIIAEFGVILQLWMLLSDVANPSWAVALGTPVLVLAALGHALHLQALAACAKVLPWWRDEEVDVEDRPARSVQSIASRKEKVLQENEIARSVAGVTTPSCITGTDLESVMQRDQQVAFVVAHGGVMYQFQGSFVGRLPSQTYGEIEPGRIV